MNAFGRGIGNTPPDSRARKLRTGARSIAPFIEYLHDTSYPPMLNEQVVHKRADRCLYRVRHEPLVLPLVAIDRRSSGRASEASADWNRRGDTLRDFFAFPLCHSGKKREEEPSCRRTGVDGFLKRYQIGICRPKGVGEIEEFFRVARKARNTKE